MGRRRLAWMMLAVVLSGAAFDAGAGSAANEEAAPAMPTGAVKPKNEAQEKEAPEPAGVYFTDYGSVEITKQQNELIDVIEENDRKAIDALEMRIGDLRKDLRDLMRELREIRTPHDVEIERVLTPEQRKELARQRKEEMENETKALTHFAVNLGPFLAELTQAELNQTEGLVLYEGLPHQKAVELLAEERRTKKTIQIDGFDFYAEPLKLKPTDAFELRDLLSKFGTYRPYGGPKFCGGYHPDWCLQWSVNHHTYRICICLGCHEAKLLGTDTRVTTDLDESAYEQLSDTLRTYRKNHPAK
jgi:hypothetical protein